MTGTDLSSTALVVVNFGSHALLEANLETVSSASPELLVVVVDNFTSAAEQAEVRRLGATHHWTAVLLDTNTGFGEGVNAGVATALAAGSTTLVVLNPDATIPRAGLESLVARAAAEPRSMVAPVIYRSNGRIWFGGSDVYTDDGRMGNPRLRTERAGRPYREWLTGACFAMSSELWRELGGFDPDYFLYWEDVDLSYRVVAAGGSLVVEREAEAIHDAGGTHTETLRGRAKSETYYYYNIRNRLVYAAKTLDDRQLAGWLRTTLRVSYEILLQGGRAQFIRPWVPLRAYVRGVRDGRRFVRATRPSRARA
jgi:N-acetylglucosaminyl-diphospho-decaprenol L-rhamnosyltransferase